MSTKYKCLNSNFQWINNKSNNFKTKKFLLQKNQILQPLLQCKKNFFSYNASKDLQLLQRHVCNTQQIHLLFNFTDYKKSHLLNFMKCKN